MVLCAVSGRGGVVRAASCSEEQAEARRLRKLAEIEAVRDAAAEAAVALTAELEGRSGRKAVRRLRDRRAHERAFAREEQRRELEYRARG